jgi:DNA-binding response OmpR family regulator
MSKANILVIDDDQDINNLFKIFLESQDYSVDSYTDAVDALNSFRKNDYNLVLLDLKMERMDGFKLMQKLEEIDDHVIICLITADKNFIQESKEDEFDVEKNIIYKPILLRDLNNKINSLLSLNKDKIVAIF